MNVHYRSHDHKWGCRNMGKTYMESWALHILLVHDNNYHCSFISIINILYENTTYDCFTIDRLIKC